MTEENFNKTVNLRAKQNRQEKISEEDRMRRIEMPKKRKTDEALFKKITVILTAILLVFMAYRLFFSEKNINSGQEKAWYAVKLANGDVFYGKVADLEADPVVLENVYYNYGAEDEDSQNLKLKKRGSETYGPDGNIKIIRSQILYLEGLKDDSKVLQAIRSYEK